LDNKNVKRQSFRKSLDLSPQYDKVTHRSDIKQRTFSPDHDPHTSLFSPLIKTHIEINPILKSKPNDYYKNSIKLGSKDSFSHQSSILLGDMVSKLNKNTFPNQPLKSNLVAPFPGGSKPERTSKVIPFEEVEEEEENVSKASLPPIILQEMPELAEK